MDENKIETQINFLSLAINDAQELIRFIDTKTAIVITILGSYIVGFFNVLDEIIKYSEYYSCGLWFFLFAFFVSLIVCIIITMRIIKPTNNPTENINLGNLEVPNLNFFLTPNKNVSGFAFYNSSSHKLSETFENYHVKISASTSTEIIKSLTFELLKVSFIRNIKNDRFSFLVKCLIVTTILFFVAYLFFSIETQQTINFLEVVKYYKSPICHY